MKLARASVLPLSCLLAVFLANSSGCTGEQDLGGRGGSSGPDGATAPVVKADASTDEDATQGAPQPDAGPVDKTGPTVKLTVSPMTVTSAGTVQFDVTATAPSGIAKVTIDQDGDSFATFTSPPYSGKLSVSAADNGVYSFKAIATDSRGNVGTSSIVSLTINIARPPIVDAGADAATADGGAASDAGTVLVAPAGSKRVFVTEGAYSGDLKTQGAGATGPDGADNICNQEATIAGIGGTWKAWIRDTSFGSGALRVGAHGPYARLGDNALVFSGALATGNPRVAINRTPAGTVLLADALSYAVLSALNNDGSSKSPGSDCQSWTSSSSGYDQWYGDCRPTHMHNWSSTGTRYCNRAGRLYCFEQ